MIHGHGGNIDELASRGGTLAIAAATEKVAQGGVSDNLTSLLTVLKSFQS